MMLRMDDSTRPDRAEGSERAAPTPNAGYSGFLPVASLGTAASRNKGEKGPPPWTTRCPSLVTSVSRCNQLMHQTFTVILSHRETAALCVYENPGPQCIWFSTTELKAETPLPCSHHCVLYPPARSRCGLRFHGWALRAPR